MKPIVIYYLHYKDATLMERNFSKKTDYAACVMAEDAEHAIKKVNMMLGGSHIKILGVTPGREEWVNEDAPIGMERVTPLFGGLNTLKQNQ